METFRDEMSKDESLGRIVLLLHGALYAEAVQRYGEGVEKLDTPLVGNAICFTDGKERVLITY